MRTGFYEESLLKDRAALEKAVARLGAFLKSYYQHVSLSAARFEEDEEHGAHRVVCEIDNRGSMGTCVIGTELLRSPEMREIRAAVRGDRRARRAALDPRAGRRRDRRCAAASS